MRQELRLFDDVLPMGRQNVDHRLHQVTSANAVVDVVVVACS